MIHEPTAAAMAYGLHNHADVSMVMVYDMGGGTLDVSLLHLNNGIFEVMAAAGDNRLGGQDYNLVRAAPSRPAAALAAAPPHGPKRPRRGLRRALSACSRPRRAGRRCCCSTS